MLSAFSTSKRRCGGGWQLSTKDWRRYQAEYFKEFAGRGSGQTSDAYDARLGVFVANPRRRLRAPACGNFKTLRRMVCLQTPTRAECTAGHVSRAPLTLRWSGPRCECGTPKETRARRAVEETAFCWLHKRKAAVLTGKMAFATKGAENVEDGEIAAANKAAVRVERQNRASSTAQVGEGEGKEEEVVLDHVISFFLRRVSLLDSSPVVLAPAYSPPPSHFECCGGRVGPNAPDVWVHCGLGKLTAPNSSAAELSAGTVRRKSNRGSLESDGSRMLLNSPWVGSMCRTHQHVVWLRVRDVTDCFDF